MKETIVVTGITGFVGSNLESYLKESFIIKGVSRKKDGGFLYNYEDIEKMLPTSKAFIHLAGKAHDLKKTANDAEYFEVNSKFTKELYDQFLESECKIFIYLSSVKAVRDSIKEVLVEDIKAEPITAYGKSKLLAEEYIISKPLPEGKAFYILRPCMIHGPGNKGNLNLLYNFVAKGLPYPFASFENKRSYLSVENLCFVISELIQRIDIPSGIYNVSDDEALSTTEVVSILSKALNKSPRLLYISQKIISFVAKIGNNLMLPLNTERLEKLTDSYVVSNKKIKEVLKKELPLTSREGIFNTAIAFKNSLKV